MNKISNYEELLREKERLQLQLEVHKAAVRMHVEEIDRKLSPVKKILSFLTNFTAPAENKSFVNTGLVLTLEMIIRKLFFSKTGWITRMVAPILLKNFSANMLKKNKKTLIKKVKTFFHIDGTEN